MNGGQCMQGANRTDEGVPASRSYKVHPWVGSFGGIALTYDKPKAKAVERRAVWKRVKDRACGMPCMERGGRTSGEMQA